MFFWPIVSFPITKIHILIGFFEMLGTGWTSTLLISLLTACYLTTQLRHCSGQRTRVIKIPPKNLPLSTRNLMPSRKPGSSTHMSLSRDLWIFQALVANVLICPKRDRTLKFGILPRKIEIVSDDQPRLALKSHSGLLFLFLISQVEKN